jgi:hypothetical protein
MSAVQADEPTSQPTPATDANGQEGPGLLRWRQLGDDSTLLPQAVAATASLRALIAAERGVEIETIDLTATGVAAAEPQRRDGNCKHLPLPGSRFMTERCFYETRGEEALNDYQLEQDIKENIYLHQLNFLEQAEYWDNPAGSIYQ